MKTKNLKTAILAFAAGAFVCSCNENTFLDEVNPNYPSDATYWTTQEDLESGIATVYNSIRASVYGYYGTYNGFIFPCNGGADDIFVTRNEEVFTWDHIVYNNTSNTSGNVWEYLYRGISRANVVLANTGETCPVKAEIKDPIRGEAYFLRGFHYYLLAINYGKALIRTEPVTSSEDCDLAMSSREEVWAQAERDLAEAEKLLPVERSENNYGRVTRGAVIAFLGKAYLFQKKYPEAKAQLEKIMAAPYTYDLVEYENNFRDDTEFNQESIFELNYAEYGDQSGLWNSGEGTDANMGNTLANWFGPDLPVNGGWYKLQPSAYLVDEFTAEERPAGADTKWDKRMYTTFYFKYSDYGDVKADETWYNDIDFDAMWTACGKKRGFGQPDYTPINGKEGRFCLKKYTAWWCKHGPTFYGGEATWEARKTNYRVMRFAEVLLMHAEACAQTGDAAGANADLKRIRERAGLADKTFAGADLMKEIQHQNLLELVMESNRLFYLKHWYDDNEFKQAMVERKKQGAESYAPKYRWLPVPQSEMDRNTLCSQTEGW